MLPNERVRAFEDRQAEIDDLASDLRRKSRKAWKKPASFALSITGAAWTFITGNPLGALLAGGASVIGLDSESKTANSYSYIFNANKKFY